MPRPERIFVEGGVYHVYNRLARLEKVFHEDVEAAAFVDLLRKIVKRDELTVFAWCLMSNHYHLALKTSAIPLNRPMQSLQQRVTRGVNRRRGVNGPLWQGRYQAKMVDDQDYLDQLLIYIHLNPVTAGIVDDPAVYRWSGHRELLEKDSDPIVDVDEVLRVFGTTRRSARAAYVRRLKGSYEEEWIGEQPGQLPWWRLGRPQKGEDEDPEEAIRDKRKREKEGPDWRPSISVRDFVAQGAAVLGVEPDEFRSRRQNRGVVRGRELLVLLGVERYGLKLRDLAKELQKSPDGMTKAVARAARRRTHDFRFRADLNELDRALSGDGKR